MKLIIIILIIILKVNLILSQICSTVADCPSDSLCSTPFCNNFGLCDGIPVSCDDENECTFDFCSEENGCSHDFINCNDFDACTDDSCDRATGCAYSNITCSDDNNPCTLQVCDPEFGCQYPPKCTDDVINCGVASCSQIDGSCSQIYSPDLPYYCNDQNACTFDSCINGTSCVHTLDTCDDQNMCTTDTCFSFKLNELRLCSNKFITCNDQDPCTTDTCIPSDGCKFDPVICPVDPNNICRIPFCTPTTGICNFIDADCSNSIPTTLCQYPGCDPLLGCIAIFVDCNDNDPCTTDQCSDEIGCENTPIDCELDEITCFVGTCDTAIGCANQTIVCDDDDICTSDSCIVGQGCRYTPILCSDGDICDTESCLPDVGCQSLNITCDDLDSCTIDTCIEGQGCQFTPIQCEFDELQCEFSFCNPNNQIQCELFTLQSPIYCQDNDNCTTDSCVPGQGCINSPVDCDDRNRCTIDRCEPNIGCVNIQIPNCDPTPTPTVEIPKCICPLNYICIEDEHLCIPPDKFNDCDNCLNPETECALGYECKESKDGAYVCKKIQRCLSCEDLICQDPFVCDLLFNPFDSQCSTIPHCRS